MTTTQSQTAETPPIMGWDAIAKAVTKAIRQSVCSKSARRYAAPGRDNRLPVYRYPNGRVYLMPEDLSLWAKAWLRRRPPGAVPSGKAA